jgi:IclR family acetate operon transcriptional repressor
VKNNNSEKENNSVRALERGLLVLGALELAGRPLNLTELRHATHLSNATVLRMLSTLEKYGFTEKGPGGYRIGVGVLPLSYGFLRGHELTLAALPVLQDLARMSEETASLFVRHGFHRIVVQRVEGQYPLRYFLPIGQRLPLCLGMGKVLAAAMPESELKQMVDQAGEMHLSTGKRLTRKALLEELDRVRRQGFSISINERVMGSASVAAPVITASGATIAAVGVIGTVERMNENKLRSLSVEVRRAAKAIAEHCSARE